MLTLKEAMAEPKVRRLSEHHGSGESRGKDIYGGEEKETFRMLSLAIRTQEITSAAPQSREDIFSDDIEVLSMIILVSVPSLVSSSCRSFPHLL